MGASLATGGAGFFKDGQNKANAEKARAVFVQRTLAWSDLVRTYKTGRPPELSLAKAQMLFWAVFLLALFVLKSMLEGAIWEVPWPLAFLMGFSQAGYLAPKLTEGSTTPLAPAAPAP